MVITIKVSCCNTISLYADIKLSSIYIYIWCSNTLDRQRPGAEWWLWKNVARCGVSQNWHTVELNSERQATWHTCTESLREGKEKLDLQQSHPLLTARNQLCVYEKALHVQSFFRFINIIMVLHICHVLDCLQCWVFCFKDGNKTFRLRDPSYRSTKYTRLFEVVIFITLNSAARLIVPVCYLQFGQKN